ncbi:Urb2/Npa2 family-domain-containing protein [Ganoderma leucocontextum]|nr:Urb2/Npa2 family-domain-containing protein [Ganoderma leucocontextum]
MLAPQNAQDFIRALKASSDPPHAGGPVKVQIARQVWDNQLLYVPNKAEAIVDWLLSRLLKDKPKDRHENPIVDTRYWKLLADILTHSHPAREGDHSRTLRPWLVPLLNRIPIAPVILSYLELASPGDQFDLAQYKLFARCVSILWPLAVPKFSPETLLECFGAVVQLSVPSVVSASDRSWGTLQALDDFRASSSMVVSYRTSLAGSASKRKQLYTLFLKKHLPCWLHLVSSDGDMPTIVSDVYDAGIETMFGLEILKQTAENKHASVLSEALENTSKDSPAVVLRSLPRLFASYVQNVKRHKGALFSQGSNQALGHITDEVQPAAMAFYATCNALARTRADDASWQCRVYLLEVVERETLLNSKDSEARMLLRRDGDLAVEALAAAWDERHATRTDCAVKILATLTRIDYDLMSASFNVIYPRLLVIPCSISSALQYLQLLLEYDSKTRDLPSAIVHVSEAFSVPHLERIPNGPHAAYQLACSSPLTSLPFLDELARAVHNFLTPGQVLETIADVSRSLKDAYERFVKRDAGQSADHGDGPRKKRRKGGAPPSSERSDSEYHAISFALVARTMVVVLRALPLHSLTDDTRAEAERSVREVYATVATRALVDGLRNVDRSGSQSWQFIVTGVLHLHYSLARASAFHQELPLEDELLSDMLKCVSSAWVKPEVVVEMFRTLLHQCTLGSVNPDAVFDRLLDYLEMHLSCQNTTWTGKSHALSAHSTGGVAVLHLLVDRWLPEFNARATSKQLERLASVLVNARGESHDSRPAFGLSVQSILSRMLHDAQFWELLSLREAFIAKLIEQTASLTEFDVSNLLSHLTANTPRPTVDAVSRIASAYGVVLITPPEFLPRATHIEFLKRGFVADIVVYLTLRYAQNSQLSVCNLLIIREVLRRAVAHLGVVENVSKEFLNYLLEQGTVQGAEIGVSKDVNATTMDLVDVYQGYLVRLAKKGEADSVIELARRYIQSYDAASPNRPSLLLIDALVQNTSSSDLPTSCVNSLRDLEKSMLRFSLPLLSPDSDDRELPLDYNVLDIWAHVRTLGRWLGVDDSEIPNVGMQLSRRLLSPKPDSVPLGPVVLSILLGELQGSPPGEARERIEYVTVAYLALVRVGGRDGVTDLESPLASDCRMLSTGSFSSLLDLVYDGLPLQKGLSTPDVVNLIRLSSILLREAPEGTAKICQAHTTGCLNLFADNEHFTASPALRGEVLDFLVRQCSDRPASMRMIDLSSLWSIIRALLSRSTKHEPSTDATIFHGIVNVLSALVRLRRDLVLNTLPHLGFVLRKLVACLRSLRPQLGGKQTRMVMDTLPRWISPSGPLSTQESKALARLLTTLTTKTIIRVHGAAADTQKPESLVRPFSKHAAYVLTSYADAVNDPLCFVSLGIRKELQPGLFALCEMLGEHIRDAMMVSALDAGGKATMKVLWKEYEKQRYVGKG